MIYLLQYKERGEWKTCCKVDREKNAEIGKTIGDCLQTIGLEVREIPDIETIVKVM